MKQLIDFLPALAFFVSYFQTKDFMAATIALVAGTTLQLIITWLVYRKIEKMHIVLFCILLPMASMTLLFDDERFLMWKPTLVNWVFAVALLGSHYIGARNLSQRAIEGMLKSVNDIKMNVPAHAWPRINLAAATFFFIVGLANILVALNTSESTWVSFRVFGLFALNTVGIIFLFSYLYKYMEQPPQETSEPEAAQESPKQGS